MGECREKRINIGMETETVEHKRSTGELKEAVISIAAILNKHKKGVLYFGVKNDGTVIGQEISDESMRKVSQAIGYHIAPVIYPEIKVVTFESRKCIQVNFEGNRQLYLAYNVPRIRVADEDLVMDQAAYDAMIRDRVMKWQSIRIALKSIIQAPFRQGKPQNFSLIVHQDR